MLPWKCADVEKIVAIFSTLSKRAYYSCHFLLEIVEAKRIEFEDMVSVINAAAAR